MPPTRKRAMLESDPMSDPRPQSGPRPTPRLPRSTRSRLAAIDIGSNSIHMVVVAAEAAGGYRVLGREKEMVGLGRTAFRRGALSQSAIVDALDALVRVTTLARLKGAQDVVAVATSAVREASNGEEFLRRVRAQTGLEVRVLSGAEEGRLIYRAVREAVDLSHGRGLILDVGGGSSEWITTQDGELEGVVSLPLGSLRCAGRLGGDPPTAAELTRLRRHVAAVFAEAPPPADGIDRLVATSGTAVCCAGLVDLITGRDDRLPTTGVREVKAKDLHRVVTFLARRTREEIAALPPVGEPRSESILAGAVVLDELVRRAGVDRISVCDRALREGLVLEALGRPLADAPPEDSRRRQVMQFARRVESVFRHSEQTARLAVRLFDLLVSLHGLGGREREWLEYAALLHDVGYSIQYRNHHKHAYYLITNADLDAFDRREIEIIAHVARYHRGPVPRPDRHPTLAALKTWQQRAVRKLSALLRIADALDRTHASRVDEIYGALRKGRVTLEVVSRYDVGLELAAARERGRFFAKVFDCRLRLRQGLETAGD
jgi:exopolyphosphatase / guanosine-5'-triphosphate,3'-diphosphate pyrophosphatase